MLDLLLPRRCVLCRAEGTALCADCATTLPAAPDLSAPPGMTHCWSLLAYEGPTKDLVAALKFHNHRDAVGILATAMARLVEPDLVATFDTVTWAPTSAQRRRRRGYDQAELLARATATTLGRPCGALLSRRTDHTQTGRTRVERLGGVAFDASTAVPARILLVDDVRTTGATLCAAADALTEGGAGVVCGLTLAVTL